ncbi:unnamed protein product, partial [Brenthis ino]
MNYCTFCRKSDPLKRLSSGEITGPVTRNHKIFKTVGRVEDEPGPSHSVKDETLIKGTGRHTGIMFPKSDGGCTESIGQSGRVQGAENKFQLEQSGRSVAEVSGSDGHGIASLHLAYKTSSLTHTKEDLRRKSLELR